MDYFLTTYAKDYKWPITTKQTVGDASQIQETLSLAQETFSEIIQTKLKGANETDDVVPAQVGAPPQAEVSKFDQPNTYLRKLYTKYPYLYEIMKITPPAELAKKVYSEKYKTTYQDDYGLKGYMQLQKTADSLSQSIEEQDLKDTKELCCDDSLQKKVEKKTCACDHDTRYYPCTCGEDAHPVVKVAWKPAPISKMMRLPSEKPVTTCDKKKKKEDEKTTTKLPQYKPYRSEYKDSISKIGGLIIKKKILYPQETQYEIQAESSDQLSIA